MHNVFSKFTLRRLLSESRPFIKEVVFIFIVFIVAYFSYTYTKAKANDLVAQKKRAILTLRSINQNIKSANSAIVSWQTVKNTLDNREGLDIEAFKVLVEQIKERHAINGFTITLTPPQIRSTKEETKYIDLEFNTIQINFNALTDVDAYRFINEIMASVPGMLHIERLDFRVMKSLDEKTLSSIKAGKIKDTVKVSLVFRWHNIIDIK